MSQNGRQIGGRIFQESTTQKPFLFFPRLVSVAWLFFHSGDEGDSLSVFCRQMLARACCRSHAIFMLSYTQTFYLSASGDQKVQARSKSSRIYLVDLAGSERTKLSGLLRWNHVPSFCFKLSISTTCSFDGKPQGSIMNGRRVGFKHSKHSNGEFWVGFCCVCHCKLKLQLLPFPPFLCLHSIHLAPEQTMCRKGARRRGSVVSPQGSLGRAWRRPRRSTCSGPCAYSCLSPFSGSPLLKI